MRPTQETLQDSVEVIALTPEFAQELLDHNKMNRVIRLDWVDYLATEMTEGRWHINGDTLVIDEEGELMDGQHRCLAVIKSGVTYPAVVIRQVAPEARLTIDDPMKRTFADDLVMNGQGPNATTREAVLRRIMVWNEYKGFAGSKRKVSRAELAGEYPKHREEIQRAIQLVWRHRKNVLGTSVGVFMAWLLMQNADERVVEKYFSILSIGSQDDNDAQIVNLRDKIIQLRADPMLGWRGAGLSPLIIWYAIRGWNNWLTGERSNISLPRGRKLTNPFPQPARLVR